MKKNEQEEKVLEISEDVEKVEVPTEEPKAEEPVAPTEPITYIHIDTFLATAVPLFGLNRMQATGFKAKMFGRFYQLSHEAFLKELEEYLGKKLR